MFVETFKRVSNQTLLLDNKCLRSEAPIISKISAPDQDISLNKQAKIATERPKFFSLSIIMFF